MPHTRRSTIRRQKALKGGRTPGKAFFDPDVKRWLDDQLLIDGEECSLSMLVNNLIAFVADIPIADPLLFMAASEAPVQLQKPRMKKGRKRT